MKFIVLSFLWYLKHFLSIDFLIFKKTGSFGEGDGVPGLSKKWSF